MLERRSAKGRRADRQPAAELTVGRARVRLLRGHAPSAPPIISMAGEYDAHAIAEVDRFLRRQLGPLYHQDDLVIDLDDTAFVDSSFVGLIMGIVADQRAAQRELVLTCPRGQVRRLLALVGLPNLVPVFESVDEAIVALLYGASPLIPPRFQAIPA